MVQTQDMFLSQTQDIVLIQKQDIVLILGLNLSGIYRGDDWRDTRDSGVESVGYIRG